MQAFTRSNVRAAVAILVLGFLIARQASADAPVGTAFTYQGQLKESGTAAEGSFSMTFRLFDVATGGTALGEQAVNPVVVTEGLFTVLLNGNGELSADAFNGAERWLEIQVEGATLVPRQPITAAPYALFSTAPWVTSGSDISYTAGNVGIGVSSPAYELDFLGDLRGNGRIALGNEAEFGTGTGDLAGYARLFEFSERIDDFSAATFWTPLLSATTVDPTMDLTGDNYKIILHALIGGQTPAENTQDITNLHGAEIFARHSGSGQVETLIGGVADCWLNGGGSIINATGLAAGAFASALSSGTIDNAIGIDVFNGSFSADSSVAINTGILIETPGNYGTVGDNYGLYIEDQNVAQSANYAIYSAGGDIYLNGRIAAGNNGAIGMNSEGYAQVFDFSHTITDFSETQAWSPFTSYIVIDPNMDLPSSAVYGHDFELWNPVTDASNYHYLAGSFLTAYHQGSGHVDILIGGVMGSELFGPGTVDLQVGGSFFSDVGQGHTGTIDNNYGIFVESGHAGDDGSITNNFGVYVHPPAHTRPLVNHYGIYLADQDFGTTDSYAIYSAGGDCYFDGDVEVTGTLSKGGGSFKIDHPLDPENKYLYHSFVESPDMMNIYNGNVTTDVNGLAVLTMPEWFEALNRDFRYQLTVIGQFAQAIVSQEIKDNRFAIRTDKPNVKVSWQVTGVRKDAFANANRIPVEQAKNADERGKFLHPEAIGKPPEMRVGRTAVPQTPRHSPRQRPDSPGPETAPAQNGGVR